MMRKTPSKSPARRLSLAEQYRQNEQRRAHYQRQIDREKARLTALVRKLDNLTLDRKEEKSPFATIKKLKAEGRDFDRRLSDFEHSLVVKEAGLQTKFRMLQSVNYVSEEHQ